MTYFSLIYSHWKLSLILFDSVLHRLSLSLCLYPSHSLPDWVPGSTMKITQHLTQSWFRWRATGLVSWGYLDERLDLIFWAHINCVPLPKGCLWVQLAGGPGRWEGRRRVRPGYSILLSPCRTKGLAMAVLLLGLQHVGCQETSLPHLQLPPSAAQLQGMGGGTASPYGKTLGPPITYLFSSSSPHFHK